MLSYLQTLSNVELRYQQTKTMRAHHPTIIKKQTAKVFLQK